jgi:protein O-GlcNAc transferase
MSEALTRKLREAYSRMGARDHIGAEQLCREILERAPRHPESLHLIGLVRLLGGNGAEAVTYIGQALESSPDDLAMLENLGVAFLATGQFDRAESQFRHVMARGASSGLLQMRLGLALSAQRKLEEASHALASAVRQAPGEAEAHVNLGNVLAELGRSAEALASFEQALVLQPGHLGARFNLGTLYQRLARYDDALAAFKAVLQAAPGDADTLNNLGLVYAQQKRHADAISAYRQAIASDPRHRAAYSNLGNALRAQGESAEAIRCFEQALVLDPANGDALVNLGNVHADGGRHADARALYQRALGIDARNLEAHLNLGRMLTAEGKPADAIAGYRAALKACGEQAALYRDLGNACRNTGDLDASEAAYRAASALQPQDAAAHYGLAETLKLRGQLDAAKRSYEQALAIAPGDIAALGGLTHVRQHLCAWDGLDALWASLRRHIVARQGAEIAPFSTFSMPATAEEQLLCARAWAQKHYAGYAVAGKTLGFDFQARARGERLRIGYLSWGFHKHATTFLTAELFELHDRSRFDIAAYAYGPDDGSAERARVAGACDRFADISQLSHSDAARKIYADGVDVLVDLTGYTLGARPQILALHPAPVQAGWLGYPGTMGADFMDWLIADGQIVPNGAERHYSERVLRLPDCYQVTDRRREIGTRPATREECGLPASGFVFCCFNQAYKITPEVFAGWMRVLAAVPQSVLWLAQANRWAGDNLRAAAASHGIDPGRLIFAARQPLPEYLASYRFADLALDTYPYTSHTTASDALWMGCPLVTRAGETFASRVAASIVRAAGLPELVTVTPAGYEQYVVALATEPGRLAALRQKLQDSRERSALFATPRLVSALEAAYLDMFEAWRGGVSGGAAG